MKVGVIGLGTMGMGAAVNLVNKQHGSPDASPAGGAPSAGAAGGAAVGRAAELPDDLEAVLILVVNAEQDDVLFGPEGCVPKLAPGTVAICSTTVSPEAARALEQRLERGRAAMLDAPVSGGQAGAAAGTMTVMGSGPEAAFAKAAPVLEAIAGKVWRLGEAAGVGSTVKMVNQLLAGVHIATAAEALALGIRAGADPATLYEVICSSAGIPGCGRTACRTSWPATTRRFRR